jgi:hypothetical protein
MGKGSSRTASSSCCDGKVIELTGEQLTVFDGDGDEHRYKLSREAKVTRNGRECKPADIKKGETIRMNLSEDVSDEVIAVDCGNHIPDLAIT